jgi:hypothetical protein
MQAKDQVLSDEKLRGFRARPIHSGHLTSLKQPLRTGQVAQFAALSDDSAVTALPTVQETLIVLACALSRLSNLVVAAGEEDKWARK